MGERATREGVGRVGLCLEDGEINSINVEWGKVDGFDHASNKPLRDKMSGCPLNSLTLLPMLKMLIRHLPGVAPTRNICHPSIRQDSPLLPRTLLVAYNDSIHRTAFLKA